MSDFDFKIIKKIGVLSKAKSGWQCELNIVSWNDREPVYDIREWSLDHTKMSKGKSLSRDELESLKNILNDFDINNNCGISIFKDDLDDDFTDIDFDK